MKIYRIHITCNAGHKTYNDYKTKKAALNNFAFLEKNHHGWYPINIEIIKK